jgi:hypothetical protein
MCGPGAAKGGADNLADDGLGASHKPAAAVRHRAGAPENDGGRTTGPKIS